MNITTGFGHILQSLKGAHFKSGPCNKHFKILNQLDVAKVIDQAGTVDSTQLGYIATESANPLLNEPVAICYKYMPEPLSTSG
ncbi:hypothetical protein A5320_06095 [Rheinheimera sp. SA_1]|nr:hypothetical protein A5320_06095 [Rheinheimera sp. SA_1]